MYFGHCGEGDKWVPFSWLMITGISRHSSRGREGKMMENLLRKLSPLLSLAHREQSRAFVHAASAGNQSSCHRGRS